MEQYNVIELSQKIKDYYDGLKSEVKRDAYLVIGNLGAGKSTLIGYLLGREFVKSNGLTGDVAISKDEFWDTVVKHSIQDINSSDYTENTVVLMGKGLKRTVYFVQDKRLVLASDGDPFRFEYDLSEDQQDLLNYSNFDSCEKQIDSSLDIGVFKLNRAIRQKAALSQPILFKSHNEYPDIGYENTSATFYPKLYSWRLQDNDQHVFCDSPGFLSDRPTIEERICESLFTEIMFKAVENIKGILVVIDVNSITTDRGNGLKGLARILDKLFKNTEDLKRSVLIVVTKCRSRTSSKDIIRNIDGTIKALTRTNSAGDQNNLNEIDQGVIDALSFLKSNGHNVVVLDVFDNGRSRNEIFKLLQTLEITKKECFDFGKMNETRMKFNHFLAVKLYEASEWFRGCDVASRSMADIEKLLAEYDKTVKSYENHVQEMQKDGSGKHAQQMLDSLEKQRRENTQYIQKYSAPEYKLTTSSGRESFCEKDSYILVKSDKSAWYSYSRNEAWELLYCRQQGKLSVRNIINNGCFEKIETCPIREILTKISDKPSDDDMRKLKNEIRSYRCETVLDIDRRLESLKNQKEELDQDIIVPIWEKKCEPWWTNAWFWAEKTFEYSGMPYDKVDKSCVDGQFYHNKDEPAKGYFQTTFKSDWFKGGSATVKILKKQNEIPDNENRIRVYETEIEFYEVRKTFIEQEIDRLTKDNLFIEHLIQQQTTDAEFRSKSIKELQKKVKDLENLSEEKKRKKQEFEDQASNIRAIIEEKREDLEAVYIICEIVTIDSHFTEPFMAGYKRYTENDPRRSNASENIPIRFLCKWSNQLMTDPVFSTDCQGRHHFERTTLMEKLQENPNTKCPICQTQISSSNLRPDPDLYHEINYSRLAETYRNSSLDPSNLNTTKDLVTSIKQMLELHDLQRQHEQELDLVKSKMIALNKLSEKFITPIITYSENYKVNSVENPPLLEIEFKHDTTETTINKVLSQISKDRPKQNTNKTDRTYKIPLEESEAIWLMEQIQRLSST